MNEDQRLPATWEEFQKARREAFRAGINYADGWTADHPTDDSEAERRRYPIRKKIRREWNGCRPGMVGSEVSWLVSADGKRIVWRGAHGQEVEPAVTITPERVRAWADLFANPYEEVEE